MCFVSLEPPFRFYNLQTRYISHVRTAAEEGQVLLIEAGTGFGKTIANLYGCLTAEPKDGLGHRQIVYLSKTHKQNSQVVKELATLNEKNAQKIIVTGLQMASRRQLCHIDHVANAPSSTAGDLCRNYQQLHKKVPDYGRCQSCLTLVQDQKKKLQLPTVMSLDSLTKLAERYHGCAYLTARDLLPAFDVVTGHYNYYLNLDIRKAVGMEESKPILVLDEGHNLEDILTGQYSHFISHNTLNNARSEARAVDYMLYNRLTTLTNNIELFVKTYGKENENQILTGQSMVEIFPTYGITTEFVESIERRLLESRDALLEHQKRLSGTLPSSLATDRVVAFLKMSGFKPSDFGLVVQKLPKGLRLRRECLNPALAFQDIQDNSHSIVICSGTLSPLPLWREILGLREERCVTQKFGSITDPRRVRVVAFGDDPMGRKLTSAYKHRQSTPELPSHYLGAIQELVSQALPGGVLVFAPSYDFLHQLQIPNRIAGAKAFIETPDAKENKYVLEDFTAMVRLGKKAVLAGVLGGKLSEGADFPHDLARMVILIGIPYPPPFDPIVQLKREFYDKKRKGLGQEWYTAQAYRKVAQALGRGWRTDEDYAIGILLDHRFKWSGVINQLPIWIKNRLHKARDWQDGMQEVVKFLTLVRKLD